MNLKIINANILDPTVGLKLEFGEVVVKDKTIVYVGKKYPFEEKYSKVIDALGGIVMMGLKNCHTHSAMTLFRGLGEDKPLEIWLKEYMFRYEDFLDEEAVYWATRLAILQYLEGGTTSICDMYFFPKIVRQAMQDSGIGGMLTAGCTDLGGDDEREEALDRLKQDFMSSDCENIGVEFGVHSVYTCSKKLLTSVGELAKKHRRKVFLHLSETKTEVENSYATNKMSPVKYAEECGLFENGGVAFHAVHCSEEDIKILAKNNVAVVSCPASNMKLASGIAPLRKMIDQGVKVSLGTDGAASNNALSLWREAYLAAGLQKLKLDNALAITSEEIFTMLTSNADSIFAKVEEKVSESQIDAISTIEKYSCNNVCNANVNSSSAIKNSQSNITVNDLNTFASGVGRGMVARPADIIIIDTNCPSLFCGGDLVRNLIYADISKSISHTIVGGKVLYEKGQFFVGESVDKIIYKCQNIRDNIIKKANKTR